MGEKSNEIQALILDIDQTIYKSQSLSDAYNIAMICLIAKKFEISQSDAEKLFNEKKKRIYETNKTISSTQVLVGLGIPVEKWIEFSCLMVDPRKYLKIDFGVIRTLKWLCKNIKITVVSNNNLTQLKRTYEALGVSEFLVSVKTFSLSTNRRFKPDITLYQDAMEYFQVSALNILTVGDREDIDLEPARTLGMQTYQVKTLDHFYYLDEYIKSRA